MGNYLMLGKFTDKCMNSINEMPEKVKRFKEICQEEGGKVLSYHLLMGQYDVACLIEAPNQETMAKIALIVAKRGNARTETLTAFTDNQMFEMIKKIGSN